MPECLCRLSPHLGYRLVAELRLHCRFTALWCVVMECAMVWVGFVGMPYLLRSYRADVMSRYITRHYAGATCRADLLPSYRRRYACATCRADLLPSYRRLVGGSVLVGLLGNVVKMSVKWHDVLVDIFDARMFVPALSAPRLSPRGAATIAMPLHGICWLFSGALFQSAFRGGFFRAQVACGSLYRGYS